MATSGTATITAGNTFVVVDHTYGAVPLAVNWESLDDLGGRSVWVSDKTATQFTLNINSMDLGDHAFSWAIGVGPQGEQGIQGIQGIQGPAGADGAAGTIWYVSISAPDAGEGVNGDFHFNSSTGELYRKAAGTWGLLVTLPLIGGDYEAEYCTVAQVKVILQISEDTWNAEISACIVSGAAWIDGKLAQRGLSVPASVPHLIEDANKYFAAFLFRKPRDPAGAVAFREEAELFLDTWIATFQVGKII